MGAVFLLTVRQMSGRLRLLIMAVLAGIPVLFALLATRSSRAPSVAEFESIALSGLLAGSIIPLVVLATASIAFGNEIEDRTLANLTLAPMPRWKLVIPKFLAAAAVSGIFIVASAGVTAHIAYNMEMTATLSVVAAALIEVAWYSAAFVWLGLMSPRAIGFGLAFIVLWEQFFAGFITSVRFFSIRHYALAWMHGLDPRRFAGDDHVGFLATIVITALATAAFLLLSVRRLRRMDVP